MNIFKTGILPIALVTTITATISVNTIAQTSVYKSVNEEGVVEYSDQPREGAETIKVKNPQSITLPKGADVFTSPKDEKRGDDKNTYQSIVITQPAHDSAFNSGSGQVSILSETTPPLSSNHSIQLVVDGTRYNSNKSGSFNLSNVDRGTHQVQVNVIDAAGETLISSDVTTFTLHRTTALRKRPRPRVN
jgi:uncharacterized protein DUF4124